MGQKNGGQDQHKPSNIVVAKIWICALAQPVVFAFLGRIFSSRYSIERPADRGTFLTDVLFLAGFFGLPGFFSSRYPLDHPSIRQRIERKFGAGTFEDYVMRVKPLLLASLYALGMGAACLYASFHDGTYFPPSDAGFAIGGGVGFLLVRELLKRRGLLLETPDAPAPWKGRNFFPHCIRDIRPTKLSAMLAGAVTVAGMFATEIIIDVLHVPPPATGAIFLAGFVFFLVLPVKVLVFGFQCGPDAKEGEIESAPHGRRLSESSVRALLYTLVAFLTMLAIPVAVMVWDEMPAPKKITIPAPAAVPKTTPGANPGTEVNDNPFDTPENRAIMQKKQ